MRKLWIVPIVMMAVSCGSSDEIASGEFDTGDGDTGSYSVSGDGGNTETVIKSKDGEVRFSSGDKASGDLPMGIALYPGANVQSSMTGMGNGQSGAMVVFSSSDSVDEVLGFYRKQLNDKDIDIETEIKSGAMQMIGGKREDGESVTVSVTDNGQGGVTTTILAGGKN